MLLKSSYQTILKLNSFVTFYIVNIKNNVPEQTEIENKHVILRSAQF